MHHERAGFFREGEAQPFSRLRPTNKWQAGLRCAIGFDLRFFRDAANQVHDLVPHFHSPFRHAQRCDRSTVLAGAGLASKPGTDELQYYWKIKQRERAV
jgi:hypothetical protein